MKLIYCKECKDMVKLSRCGWRHCKCGRVFGRYLKDGHKARVSRTAISIRIGNPALKEAIGKMEQISERTSKAPGKKYRKDAAIADAYVRPNEGPGNPNCDVVC